MRRSDRGGTAWGSGEPSGTSNCQVVTATGTTGHSGVLGDPTSILQIGATPCVLLLLIYTLEFKVSFGKMLLNITLNF